MTTAQIILECTCCGRTLDEDQIDEGADFCVECVKEGCPNDIVDTPCSVTGHKWWERRDLTAPE